MTNLINFINFYGGTISSGAVKDLAGNSSAAATLNTGVSVKGTNRVYCSTSTTTSSGCASSADCTINGHTGSVPLVKQEGIGAGCVKTAHDACVEGCLSEGYATLEQCTASCSGTPYTCLPGYSYTIYKCEYEGYIEYSGGYQS